MSAAHHSQRAARGRTRLCALTGIFLLAGASALAQPPSPELPAVPTTDLSALVQALESEDFEARDAATRALLGAGLPAREALLAAREAASLEARLRIDTILERLTGPERRLGQGFAPRVVPDDISGLPLAEALQRLGQMTGIAVSLDDRSRRTDATIPPAPVRFEVKGLPFFQALDRICEQEGLYFQRDFRGFGGGIVLRPGIIPTGLVSYQGPLRVSAQSLQIMRRTDFSSPPAVSAHLSLVIDAEPGSAAIGCLMPTSLPPVKDDQGREIGFQLVSSTGVRDARLFQQQQRIYLQLSMDPPAADAKALQDFQLPLEVMVATEVIDGVLEGEDLVKGGPERGPIGLAVVDDQTTGSIRRLTLRWKSPEVIGPTATSVPVQYEDVVITGPEGRPIELQGGIARSTDATGQRITLTLPATEVARLKVTLLRRWELHPVTVSLPRLPLP